MMRARAIAAALVAVALGGCGGSSSQPKALPADLPPPEYEPPRAFDPSKPAATAAPSAAPAAPANPPKP